MEANEQSKGRKYGPAFCVVPAAGTGDGVTGVPIASGPVSWLLLALTLFALTLATAWLMKRWGAGSTAPGLSLSTPAEVPALDAAAPIHAAAVYVQGQHNELARL